MTRALLCMLALAAAAAVVLNAADPVLESANAKLDKLQSGKAKPGETLLITPAEINAWVAVKVPESVPHGIRETHIELGTDTASASAMVDLPKIQESRGKSVGWALALFQGERPLKISVRVASGGGKITVFLTRVEMSGVSVEGTALDFLIKNFFLQMYPDAKIGEPVDLDYDIDHVQIRPEGLRITIKK